jgi:hypothetical protein
MVVYLVWIVGLALVFLPGGEAMVGEWITAVSRPQPVDVIPVVDLSRHGVTPLVVETAVSPGPPHLPAGGGSDPANPYPVIRTAGPGTLAPGRDGRFSVTIANYEMVTHTTRLTVTLPPGLAYVPGGTTALAYDPARRVLTWQGALAPGKLEYVITESATPLPYLDLADFGVPDLCAAVVAGGAPCAETAVTFNLGVNGYTASLYGERLRELTVTTDGQIVGGDTAVFPANGRLPDPALSGLRLAGLWRATDMGTGETRRGRWRAAILSGLVAGHDVFYAQWHDVAAAADPDLTARHAIAVVLDGTGDLSGHVFYVYDNISHPAQLAGHGYTIGLSDHIGERGATYAYAPPPGDDYPPQGYPPPAGTTLHLRPVLFGAGNPYYRTLSYSARVTGQVPQTIPTTVVARSSSPNPALSFAWSTHYLLVREMVYLPLAKWQSGRVAR